MFVDINGQLLNTVAFVGGSHTLLAHGGWIGSWELWQQPFEVMSSEWRCIAFDHRGSGESPVAPSAITPQALVDDVFGVMDHFGVERCVIAGESLGSIVVLQAVIQQPERFEGIVVVDGTPRVSDDAAAPLIVGSRTDFAATVATFVEACVPDPADAHLRRWGRNMLMRTSGESAARLPECYLEEATPGVVLEDIGIPALVIHGSDDRVIPVAVGEWMAASIPDATLVVLEGAGHVPTVTRPRELAEAIRRRFA